MAKKAIKTSNKETNDRERKSPSLVLQKVFGMDFFKKTAAGVFELPFLRSSQKHHKRIQAFKKNKREREREREGGHLVPTYLILWLSARYTLLSFFSPSAPLPRLVSGVYVYAGAGGGSGEGVGRRPLSLEGGGVNVYMPIHLTRAPGPRSNCDYLGP
jgi:hypothetical protein